MAAASHFPSQPDVWQAHYATERGFRHWPSEELVRGVSRMPRGGLAVEAGCGNGANLWFLAEHFDEVLGVDGCQAALHAAEAYMLRRGTYATVRLSYGDIRALPVEDGAAALVVDVMTSQHLPWTEHIPAFAEYRRALKLGGRLFLQHLGEPTTTKGAQRIGDYTYDELPALFPGIGPVCLPMERTMNERLCECGFAVADSRLLMKTYPGGPLATYLIMEATAV